MRALMMMAASAAMMVGTAAPAQAQMFIPRSSAYNGYDGGCGGRFTLAGARAGITVLGIDLDAGAGLQVGLHDRCRGGGGQVVYAPPPPPPPAYMQGGYEGAYGYGGGYAQPAYAQQGYAYGGYAGTASYGYPAPGGYPWPCGC